MKTNKQIVDAANQLAIELMKMQGFEFKLPVYITPKLYNMQSHRAKQSWQMAVVAFDVIEGTDVESALDEMLDDLSHTSQVSPPIL